MTTLRQKVLIREIQVTSRDILGLEERLAFLRDKRQATLQAAYDSGIAAERLMVAAGFTSRTAVTRLIRARNPQLRPPNDTVPF